MNISRGFVMTFSKSIDPLLNNFSSYFSLEKCSQRITINIVYAFRVLLICVSTLAVQMCNN